MLCYGIPWKELIRWFTRPTRSLPGEEKEGRVIPLQGTNCTKAWQGDRKFSKPEMFPGRWEWEVTHEIVYVCTYGLHTYGCGCVYRNS